MVVSGLRAVNIGQSGSDLGAWDMLHRIFRKDACVLGGLESHVRVDAVEALTNGVGQRGCLALVPVGEFLQAHDVGPAFHNVSQGVVLAGREGFAAQVPAVSEIPCHQLERYGSLPGIVREPQRHGIGYRAPGRCHGQDADCAGEPAACQKPQHRHYECGDGQIGQSHDGNAGNGRDSRVDAASVGAGYHHREQYERQYAKHHAGHRFYDW